MDRQHDVDGLVISGLLSSFCFGHGGQRRGDRYSSTHIASRPNPSILNILIIAALICLTLANVGQFFSLLRAPTASNFTARKTTSKSTTAQWQAQMWAIVESAFKSEVPALSFTFFKPATRPNIDNACVDEED
jgi:hypothetical protein